MGSVGGWNPETLKPGRSLGRSVPQGHAPPPTAPPRSGKRGAVVPSLSDSRPHAQHPDPASSPHATRHLCEDRPAAAAEARVLGLQVRAAAGSPPRPCHGHRATSSSAPHCGEEAGRAVTPMALSVLSLGYDHHKEPSAWTESQQQGVGALPAAGQSRPTPGLATLGQDARHGGPGLCDHRATQCPPQTHWSQGRCPLPVVQGCVRT